MGKAFYDQGLIPSYITLLLQIIFKITLINKKNQIKDD